LELKQKKNKKTKKTKIESLNFYHPGGKVPPTPPKKHNTINKTVMTTFMGERESHEERNGGRENKNETFCSVFPLLNQGLKCIYRLRLRINSPDTAVSVY